MLHHKHNFMFPHIRQLTQLLPASIPCLPTGRTLPEPRAVQTLQHPRLPKAWISQTPQHLGYLRLLNLKRGEKRHLSIYHVLKEKLIKCLLFWNSFLPFRLVRGVGLFVLILKVFIYNAGIFLQGTPSAHLVPINAS